MKSRITAEEVLTLIAYHVEVFTLPARHKYGTSYEEWLYRNGLLRRIRYLQEQRLLARERADDRWVYRLTAAGHQALRDGRDPEPLWDRPWDGWWRVLVFDLPVRPGHKQLRRLLIRWLRQHGFGYLQDSVWITPDPVDEMTDALRKFRDDVASVILLESRCVCGYTDATLVSTAWSANRIREHYTAYQQFASAMQQRLRHGSLSPAELLAALRQERRLWAAARAADPLLPRALWPVHYDGPRAWQVRQDLLCLLVCHLTTG